MNQNLELPLETIQNQVRVLSQAEGYFDSAVLFSLLRLGLFEIIGPGSLSLEELSKQVEADPELLSRLLRAAHANGLIDLSPQGAYRIPSELQPVLLESGGPAYVGHWLRHLDDAHQALFSIDQVVTRKREPTRLGDHFWYHSGDYEGFSMAMHTYAASRGNELSSFLDLSSAKSLLDLACGTGTYSYLLGKSHPHLRLVLLDLPEVLAVARKVAKDYDLTNPIEYVAADVLSDPIPGTYDAVLVSNALHLFGESASRQLLHRIYTHLNPGGSVVVQAQFLEESGRSRWPIMLDLILLSTSPAGKNHSTDQAVEWLEEAGFQKIEIQPMSLFNVNGFVRGYKPLEGEPSHDRQAE